MTTSSPPHSSDLLRLPSHALSADGLASRLLGQQKPREQPLCPTPTLTHTSHPCPAPRQSSFPAAVCLCFQGKFSPLSPASAFSPSLLDHLQTTVCNFSHLTKKQKQSNSRSQIPFQHDSTASKESLDSPRPRPHSLWSPHGSFKTCLSRSQ